MVIERRRRNTLLRAILTTLSTAVSTADAVVDAISPPPGLRYKSWMSKEEYARYYQRQRQRHREQQEREERRRQRRNVYKVIQKLRDEGLVRGKTRGRRRWWRLTLAGMRKLRLLRKKEILPIPNYSAKAVTYLVVVSFDIPEKERYKRKWLRDALKNMGFTMLHESVWIGRYQLPDAFIKDLHKYALLRYVHIVSVHRQGTVYQKES